MKKILCLLLSAHLYAGTPSKGLVNYQQKYSLCKGTSDYQISTCLLNGNLNYNAFRGDKSAYRQISTKKISQAVRIGKGLEFTLEHLPKTKRYTSLIKYADYLYTLRKTYAPPKFKGNKEEDIKRIKKIFNLFQNAQLTEDSNIGPSFESEVLEYQRRNGLAVDGDIGPQTRRALKQNIYDLLKRVKKNLALERISTPKPSKYILVNIPEYKMSYFEASEPLLSMRIVVGKRKMRTPIFNRKIKYIVKNPRWNVPSSIYRKEYAHQSYAKLKRQGFAYNSDGRLYQKSGPRNALGKVKFLFPNHFNVYMHDTPAKSLFKKRTRAFSHGCIRLEKPMELLNTLGYSYTNTQNKWLTLKHKIPVFIEYHTVWVDPAGVVQFRPDIYGYEKKLFR
ncbi:MAG: L,D-transpeptidase family protein [Sulfurovum sp.]|nr:L,D-transpeptidase family protein [Sulfurovum sp.]